jgi:hypothetical protein
VFLLGRAFGGSAVGLAAAGFVAISNPLVHYSRLAWVPSLFLLLFVLTCYAWYRGFVQDHGRWQIVGALVFVLALLSYEFAILLPASLALYLALSVARGQWTWYRGRATLLAFGLAAAGLILFGVLTVTLRIGTLAGPLSEATYWLAPQLSWRGATYFVRQYEDYRVLLFAALLGLPLLAGWRSRGTLYLGLLLLLVLGVPSFILRDRLARYLLPALPLLAIVVAAGMARLATIYSSAISRSSLQQQVLRVVAIVGIFALVLPADLVNAARRLRRPPPGPTWVQALQQAGIQPNDLILGEGVTKIRFYFGHAEYYLRLDDYERYAYGPPDALRYIYSDSLLLTRRGDFERLVEEPNYGRTLWLVGTTGKLEDRADEIDPRLWPSLVKSADRTIRTRDGWELVRLTLPRRGDSG